MFVFPEPGVEKILSKISSRGCQHGSGLGEGSSHDWDDLSSRPANYHNFLCEPPAII